MRRFLVDPESMVFRYQLRTSTSDEINDYRTFGEARRALVTSLRSDDDWWELVRASDNPNAGSDVLSGVGVVTEHPRFTQPRHYPPQR